jgi:2-polyprenyl-3-methyl-5-hydroxy-6-metoxy-1,4-benzoquinol methylase
MDTEILSTLEMKETLSFLSLTNRHFGGCDVVLRNLKHWSQSWNPSEKIELLDVGTGGAELSMAVVAWAKKSGFSISITAIDLVEEVVQVAQENARHTPEIQIYKKDVFELAEENKKFDYVIASLLLHHIPPSQSVDLLHAFDRLTRRGIIISDLYRSYPSLAAVSMLSWLAGNRIVRHDGPLSVRRSFRLKELNDLAQQANLTYLVAKREPWFRLSLAGEKKS